MVYRFCTVTTQEQFEKALDLRHRVYCQRMGYFEGRSDEDRWDGHATHFIAVDVDDQVVGTIRFIPSGAHRLPMETFYLLSNYVVAMGISRYAEVSRFVIDYQVPPADRRSVPFGLFKCIYDHAIETGTNDLFATSKAKLLPKYTTIGFDEIGEPFMDTDFNELCAPIHLDIKKAYDAYLKSSSQLNSTGISVIVGDRQPESEGDV